MMASGRPPWVQRVWGGCRGATRATWAVLAVALGLLGSGCREGYLPYYDAAAEPWEVSYDDAHTLRIEHRRALLDRIAAHPRDFAAIRELAESEWSIGRQAEAIQVLDYLLEQLNGEHRDSSALPEGRVTLLLKVRYLTEMAYAPARMAAAQRILDHFPDDDRGAEYWYRTAALADALARQAVLPEAAAAGRQQAEAALVRALAADRTYAEALQLKAKLAFEDGRWEEVIELCQRWSAELPHDGRAWYTRGVALQRLKQYTAAVPMFEQAVALEPQQPDPWYGLAIANMAGGDREAARAALEKVIQLQPTHAQAYYKLFLLYSEQPLTAERFQNLVQAATLARRDVAIQEMLIATVRADRPDQKELLLFGLKNRMNLELELSARLQLGPILDYVHEARAQGHYEDAVVALQRLLDSNNLRLGGGHPEIGLELLQLADHWIDPETAHWSPPAVALLDPTQPLAAENIGRPVLYKSVLDEALFAGAYMFTETGWEHYRQRRYGLHVESPEPTAERPVLAMQLDAADNLRLTFLQARLNVARAEHLTRIVLWQQALAPIVPYHVDGVTTAPAFARWWLQAEWDSCKRVKVSDLVELEDSTNSTALSRIGEIGPALADELRTGLSRDNYSDKLGELLATLEQGEQALDLVARMKDPLRAEATPDNLARHREWIYLQARLAPLLAPGAPLGDPRVTALRQYGNPEKKDPGFLGRWQRLSRGLAAVFAELPDLLKTEPSAARRRDLERLLWYWWMRTGDAPSLAAAVAAPPADSFAANDPYACAARLWLREYYQERGWVGAGLKPPASGVAAELPPITPPLRADLERLLAGLSSYETVPARRLRMQISTVTGLALGDYELAAAAAENLARIEASTDNGQETGVLNLLSMIYAKQERWYPAIFCLRRSVARIDASLKLQAERGQGPAVSFSVPENLRLLRWRLVLMWRQVGRAALADEQLNEIAGLDAAGVTVDLKADSTKSPSRAAALYALAARRMADHPLKDAYALAYRAYRAYEAPSDKIEQYRMTYCLIALAADPDHNIAVIRKNIEIDQQDPAVFKADYARIQAAFDAALQGREDRLLSTPALAAGYPRPAQEALYLALAIAAAHGGRAEEARAQLRQAAAAHCAGVAGMQRAIGLLVEALLADRRGDGVAKARWRAAWLAEGGLAEYVDGAAAATPEPAPAN